MSDLEIVEIPIAASIISLAIALLTAAGLFVLWCTYRTPPPLIGGIGFLVVSPVWFLSPIRFRYFLEPLGGKATYRRKLTSGQGLLSLAGYTTILAAIVTWLIQLLLA